MGLRGNAWLLGHITIQTHEMSIFDLMHRIDRKLTGFTLHPFTYQGFVTVLPSLLFFLLI